VPYTVVSLAERPELEERAPFGPGWPKFIFHDPVAKQYIETVFRRFADLHLLLLDERDEIVAGGWAVTFAWNGRPDDLPPGWDGALERAVLHDADGVESNTLAPMATEVPAAHRGKGLSRDVLGALRGRAAERDLAMIAPARPTLKHRYPLTPIERYAAWTTPDGAPFDPWLRTHYRLGAEVFAIAPSSMVIEGTVAEWEEWTDMRFPETGRYVVPDALDLVDIDLETDRGRYVEPAVWMRHFVA